MLNHRIETARKVKVSNGEENISAIHQKKAKDFGKNTSCVAKEAKQMAYKSVDSCIQSEEFYLKSENKKNTHHQSVELCRKKTAYAKGESGKKQKQSVVFHSTESSSLGNLKKKSSPKRAKLNDDSFITKTKISHSYGGSIDFNDLTQKEKSEASSPVDIAPKSILKEVPEFSTKKHLLDNARDDEILQVSNNDSQNVSSESHILDTENASGLSKNNIRFSRKVVTFEPKIQVTPISFNNGIPRKQVFSPKCIYEVKDLKIILSKNHKNIVKRAKYYKNIIFDKKSFILKYCKMDDLNSDLRLMGLKEKTYVENKIVVNGIGYKETEESVFEYFSSFGDVEKVCLEKNTKGYCTGKGTITFVSNIDTNREFELNNRLLRIERIKKEKKNCTRLFISHINKDINISKMRMILKNNGFIAKNINITLGDNKKNLGYGFVEFGSPEYAERFLQNYEFISKYLGSQSYAEYSNEKK